MMNDKQLIICTVFKNKRKEDVLNGIPRQETCSERCPPPRLHNRVYSENNQSNEKFRDFNFSLKPVTVADETTMKQK